MALSAGMSLLIAVNGGVSDVASGWLVLLVMVAAIAVIVFIIRRRTIKQNCMREYYVLDNTGALFFVDASALAFDGRTAHSAAGAVIKDIADTAKGMALAQQLVSDGTLPEHSLRIASVKSIRNVMGFYVVSCRVENSSSKSYSLLLHIPVGVSECELLINELELIMRDS